MNELPSGADDTRLLERQQLINKIEQEFPDNETRLPVKKQIISQITDVFDFFVKQLKESVEYKYGKGSTYISDQIVTLFVTTQIAQLEQNIMAAIKEASKKSKPEAVLNGLFGIITDANGTPVSFASTTPMGKAEKTAIPLATVPQELPEVHLSTEAKEGLPRGGIVSTAWILLTTYDFSAPETESQILQLIADKKLPLGPGFAKTREPYLVAKQLFDHFNQEAFTITSPVSFATSSGTYTASLQLLLKSFYSAECVTSKIDKNTLKNEIIQRKYEGKTARETFFKLIKIPEIKGKGKQQTIHVTSQVDLSLVVQALTNPNLSETTKQPVGPHILTFGEKTIDMAPHIDDMTTSYTSGQVFYELVKWFKDELPSIGHLIKKLKLPVFNANFVENILPTQEYIEENVVIKPELKQICDQVYLVLEQFHNFVMYYCDTSKDSGLRELFLQRMYNIHDIDLSSDAGYLMMLKKIMPFLAFNAKGTHVYSFFVTFLNKAKGNQPINGLKEIIGTLDDFLQGAQKEVVKVAPPKRSTNDESELITDRSDKKVEEYIANLPSFKKLQELFVLFRNSKSNEAISEAKKEWRGALQLCGSDITTLHMSGKLTSLEKHNAIKTYLLSFSEDINKIPSKAKEGKKIINFAREIRKILV